MKSYKFMTPKDLAKAVAKMPVGITINFTFDQSENDFWYGEPTVWFGMKKMYVFDGTILAIGYYGGGYIKAYDLYDYIDPVTEVDDFESILLGYMCNVDQYAKLYCVEVTEENKEYINGGK